MGGTVKKLLIAGTALVATAALLSACGSDDNKETKQKQRSAPATSAASTADATVKTAETSIGSVLVDAQGKTLYLFANDQGTTSAVPAGLLAAWPPLVASGTPVAGDGVDKSKLGTAQQPDGQTYVTYNGHPLYTFTGDASAGQTNGHKLGSVWYAITPQGDQAA
jgi:predicted lipoprotein with Yx(FWY)xxD motif